MYVLKNWYLTIWDKNVIAHGNVYNNSKFENGDFIHTSVIKEFNHNINEKQYIACTNSGSEYILAYEDMQFKRIDSIRKSFELLKQDLSVLNVCEKVSKEKKTSMIEDIDKKLKPNQLYLICSASMPNKAFFKNKNGEIREIEPYIHVGMFQDSVLITDYDGGVDFRVFPNVEMEPYHWSDNLEAVIIKNDGSDVYFMGTKENILCETGKETLIIKDAYCGEGLISPDVVNGKCLLKPKDGE